MTRSGLQPALALFSHGCSRKEYDWTRIAPHHVSAYILRKIFHTKYNLNTETYSTYWWVKTSWFQTHTGYPGTFPFSTYNFLQEQELISRERNFCAMLIETLNTLSQLQSWKKSIQMWICRNLKLDRFRNFKLDRVRNFKLDLFEGSQILEVQTRISDKKVRF